MAVNYVKSYITKNPYFNDGRWLTGSNFLGFFLHSVGCAQPDPMVFIKGWNDPGYTRAGINGFIDNKTVHITAPCLETPGTVKRMPHAGSPANNYYIGFEMTEPRWLHYTGHMADFTVASQNLEATKSFVRGTYNVAVEFFARLCIFHNKNPLQDGVIMSHKEGALAGIATNHGDPEHLWDQLSLGYTMKTFRQAVANKMKEKLPALVLTNNTDMSVLFTNNQSYDNTSGVSAISLPGIEIVPYMATIDRDTKDVDYDKLKETGVVGMCIEAGYLYDISHNKVSFKSPKFRQQVKEAEDADLPFALFSTTRARSVEEAKQETYELSFCIRTAPPMLGFWLKLKLTNTKAINDIIIQTYQKELSRLGLKDKIGLYVTKAELSSVTWEIHSNDWWLWIDSHLAAVDAMDDLLTPHVFALDEVN